MLEFSDKFWTIVTDHFLTYWMVCGILFGIDCFLYHSGSWNTFKLHSIHVPDTWGNIIKLVLFNQIFVSIPLIYLFVDIFPDTADYTVIPRMITTLLIFEIIFYYSHRLLHMDPFYKYIHKIHHRWNYPLAISTFYTHPIEHALINVLPVVLGAYFAGLPFYWTRRWHIFAVANGALVSHGGFRLSKMHDQHHVYTNVNYGALGLLDIFHKTEFRYYDHKNRINFNNFL